MTTHQSHNIPWSALVDNLVWRTKPGGTEYNWYPAQKPGEEKAIKHFARKVASTITTFSETERKKYPANLELDSEKIFPDSLIEPEAAGPGYPDRRLTEKHQSLEWWIGRASEGWDFRHGDEADAIKTLFVLDRVDTLLFLAQNKETHLGGLEHITYSNFFHYGTRRVMENAIVAYLMLNMHAALNLMGDSFRPSAHFRRVHSYLTQSSDHDTHQEIHREFFKDNENLHDVGRLSSHLKRLFRLLYVWDVVSKEYGKEVDWEAEVLRVLDIFWGFPSDPAVWLCDM